MTIYSEDINPYVKTKYEPIRWSSSSPPPPTTEPTVDYQHMLHDTPAKFIWDMAGKYLDRDTTDVVLRHYSRGEDSSKYGGPQGANFAMMMGDENSWYENFNLTTQISPGPSEYEVAFMGFSTSPADKIFSHDIPRCDMKFSVSKIETSLVQNTLLRIKEYLGGASLYLYKTSNSFHLYGNKILTSCEINTRLNYLKKIDKYQGVIDSNWLQINTSCQPLRITRTSVREYPHLYCIL